MEQKDLEKLPMYGGFYYDPATGKLYWEDGRDTTFTFERATWTGPFGIHFSWPWLNPIGFATRETALRVLNFCRGALPEKLSVTLDESDRIVGPFSRTVERTIVVSDGSREENYSAGWLANSIIRNGNEQAARMFRSEVRGAGMQA
ncbi:MAG: hypothetical protein FJW39_14485 [Acidobacteria bacterium]|nr:hypothetical protein [Acidobacteriota bacterium]